MPTWWRFRVLTGCSPPEHERAERVLEVTRAVMSSDRTTTVVIVDDSATARVALRGALRTASGIRVVGEAASPESALEMVERLHPDIVTLDMYMRGTSGLSIAREIMQLMPTPIVLVTSVDPSNQALVYDALRAGVLEVLGKPPAPSDPTYERRSQELARAVKTLSRVPVVRRVGRQALVQQHATMPSSRAGSLCAEPPGSKSVPLPFGTRRRVDDAWRPRVVLLGASTGGPPVLSQLLRTLPKGFEIPIVVVQHLAGGFTDGFATWLQAETGREAMVVRGRTPLEAGQLFIAGEGGHLKVVAPSQLAFEDGEEVSYHRPSIDVLFRSAARYVGGDALAILFTGLGADGAHGMRTLFDAGAWTVAQSPPTCTVDSMPRRALELGGVCCCLTPAEMSAELARFGSRVRGT